jgi:hypothetical protein
MELLEFENKVRLERLDWTLSKSQSGAAMWIDIVTPNNLGFTIQVTPNDGIGVSRRSGDELDFGGHDEVLGDLGEVLQFLESQAS